MFSLTCVVVSFFSIVSFFHIILTIVIAVVITLRVGWIILSWFSGRKLLKPVPKKTWQKFVIAALGLSLQVGRKPCKQPFELAGVIHRCLLAQALVGLGAAGITSSPAVSEATGSEAINFHNDC